VHGGRLVHRIGAGAIGVAIALLSRGARAATAQRRNLTWRRHNLLYRGSPNDLFIVSYPKSGTTLVQMLVYQLMTDGRMDLPHIRQFSPEIDAPILMGAPGFAVDALPAPRVLKSHLPYRCIPKGPGRYIYVMRNGLDVALSAYHQARRTGDTASFEEYVDRFVSGREWGGGWFDHVAGWARNARGLDVLYVTFEDLVRDFPRAAGSIAAFCGVAVDEAEWARIATNCSFASMRRHERMVDPLDGLAATDRVHFIRAGRIGDGQTAATPAMRRAFHAAYDRVLRGLHLPPSLRGSDGLTTRLSPGDTSAPLVGQQPAG
jgi:hypothetical protein